MKAGEQVLKYEMYNPDEKCNCVVRALSKMLEKNVINVKDELINLATEMNHIDYTDVHGQSGRIDVSICCSIRHSCECFKIAAGKNYCGITG